MANVAKKPFRTTKYGSYYHDADPLGAMGCVFFVKRGGTRRQRLGLTENQRGFGSRMVQARKIAARHHLIKVHGLRAASGRIHHS